jgi:molecular chaperone DnaJ
MSDYYEILGVPRNASQDEIKAAFRRLAMEHHPDRGGDPEKFKKINEAYQTLSNPETRAQYDRYGATFEQMRQAGRTTGFEGFHDWINYAEAFDFGDLFEGFSDIFGSAFNFGRQTHSRKKQVGRDLEMTLEISFEESVKGTSREIEIEKIGLCSHCGGSGAEPGSKISVCKTCGGKGQIRQTTRSFFGTLQTVTICEACGGEGKRPEVLCSQCRGKGTAKVHKRLLVKIPAGISDGEIIRLAGEGEAVGHGGRPGNLYIKVKVKPHMEFERRGNNIYSRVFLDFKTAALGGKIEVKTIDGLVDLKIPPGTQSNQVFRLRGKGVPYLDGGGRGDHFVEVVIKVPERLTKKQREILEEWDE